MQDARLLSLLLAPVPAVQRDDCCSPGCELHAGVTRRQQPQPLASYSMSAMLMRKRCSGFEKVGAVGRYCQALSTNGGKREGVTNHLLLNAGPASRAAANTSLIPLIL